MSNFLIKNATVLTFEPLKNGSLDMHPQLVNVLIEDDVITQVGAEVNQPAEQVIDAKNQLLIPGFVDAHTHSIGVLEKASYEALPLELWMLFVSPPTWRQPLNPRIYYLCAAIAGIEAVKHGTTTIQDDLYALPHNTPEVFDAVAQAYIDVGIRANVSYSVINKPLYDTIPYLRNLLPVDLREELESVDCVLADEWLAEFKSVYSKWQGTSDRLNVILSPNAPQRVTPDLLEQIAMLSEQHNIPIHSHMLETRIQAITGPELYGESIIQYSKRHGILTERTTIGHGVWLDRADMELIAETGASVSHNIVCNHRLCSGIANVREMIEVGIPIAIGSDGMETFNLFDVIKMTGLVHSVVDTQYKCYPKAHDVLKWATHGGAQAAGLQGTIGAIAPGYKADFVLYDLNTVSFTPRHELPIHLVYAEHGKSIRKVFVNGKIIVENDRITTLNEQDILAELRDLMPDYLSHRNDCHKASHQILPYMQKMFEISIAKELSAERFSHIH